MLSVSEQLISGKWADIGETAIFSLNKSNLLRKRMTGCCLNHLPFIIESKSIIASCIWFCLPFRYLYVENKMIRTYRIVVFNQTLIITRKSGYENQTIDIFEAMDPFLAL